MYAAAFGYASITRASAFGALLKAAATINPKERKTKCLHQATKILPPPNHKPATIIHKRPPQTAFLPPRAHFRHKPIHTIPPFCLKQGYYFRKEKKMQLFFLPTAFTISCNASRYIRTSFRGIHNCFSSQFSQFMRYHINPFFNRCTVQNRIGIFIPCINNSFFLCHII